MKVNAGMEWLFTRLNIWEGAKKGGISQEEKSEGAPVWPYTR
jgi:hypothetical protein